MNTISLQCIICDGRGVNEHGSECQYCDLGQAEFDGDFIAMAESGDIARYYDHSQLINRP